jgi:PAS domain S-box-containing protein
MKKKTLLFLRFILILCTVLVMTYSKKGLAFPSPGYTIALLYLTSNLVFYFLSEKIFTKPLFSFFVFLFDIVTISLTIYFIQGVQTDFFLIYFLVIFIASVSQDIKGSLPTAIVASLIYGWLIYRSNPGISILSPVILLRVPFLFIISLISSYWSASTRRELKKKEELEKFNRELKKEVDRIASEEIALRRYTEKIINNFPSGVIAVSNDGTITTLNPEAVRVLGLSKGKTSGKDIRNINGLDALWRKMEQSIVTGSTVRRDEVTIHNQKGKSIPIGLSISPIGGLESRFSGCVTIFKDLSEIKTLQERLKQAEKLSYLGKMASWVAHEIRNPLAAIDGFAHLIVDTKKQKKIALYSAEIFKGAERINNIIEDILAFAKTKREKPKLAKIDLRSLIDHILRDMNIKMTIKDGKAPVIEGETESIRRVFINLITNSVEAMDKDGHLKIKFASNKKCVITEITDNGAGIPKEELKDVLTPFFTTKERGTGLGLAIVQKIIEEHNGKIDIKSEEGVGTIVRVFLPKKVQKGSKKAREGIEDHF